MCRTAVKGFSLEVDVAIDELQGAGPLRELGPVQMDRRRWTQAYVRRNRMDGLSRDRVNPSVPSILGQSADVLGGVLEETTSWCRHPVSAMQPFVVRVCSLFSVGVHVVLGFERFTEKSVTGLRPRLRRRRWGSGHACLRETVGLTPSCLRGTSGESG